MTFARNPRRIANRSSLVGGAIGLALALATQVQAAGSGMPWEEPLQQVLELSLIHI